MINRVINIIIFIKNKLAEEKGKFTIEATIICIYIIIITMALISGIINIYNNSVENREKECGRNMTAIEAFKQSN